MSLKSLHQVYNSVSSAAQEAAIMVSEGEPGAEELLAILLPATHQIGEALMSRISRERCKATNN